MATQKQYRYAPAIGLAGTIQGSLPSDYVAEPAVSGEASAGIPMGAAVKRGADLGNGVSEALLPTAASDEIWGFVLREYYAAEHLDENGNVQPGMHLTVVPRGRMLVTSDTAASPGERFHIRAVAVDPELQGAVANAADGTDTIDTTAQGRYVTAAGARGDLATVQFDFTGA